MEADTMGAPLAKQSGLMVVQEQVADNWTELQTSGRRLVLAYFGLWGVAYDSVADLAQSGLKLLGAAEDRGERMSKDFSQRFLRIERQAAGEIKRLQDQVGDNIEHVKLTVNEARGEKHDDLERRVELMLASLGVPSRERLERLSMEIDELNARLDQELLKTA